VLIIPNEENKSDEMIRGSLFFFRRVFWVCPTVIPVEVMLFQQVFKPDDSIEVTLLLGKMQGSVSAVDIELKMDLQVFSLTEISHCVSRLEQVLLSVNWDKQKLKGFRNRQTLLVELPLAQMKGRN
jgi:hypothetical protein